MYKLGRKAVKTDSRTLMLARYSTSALAPAPVSCDWTKGVTEFGSMMNNSLGCCTIAGCGHADQIFTLNAGTMITAPDTTILSAYEAWCGYNPSYPSTDQGGIELDVLTDWIHNGFNDRKLLAFANVDPQHNESVKQGISMFGGQYIGMLVPGYIMNDVPPVWDVQNDPVIDGWHCVFCTGYDADTVTFISWGQLYKMTWAFWNKYVDESHTLISPDFIAANGLTPNGFNLEQLLNDKNLIS
jgi:hypothetical protein